MIIKAQRGRGNKIHLLLDGDYIITTDSEFWLENYISDGTNISDDEWQELVLKISYRKAFNKCADLLSRRDHSVKELRDKLLRTVDEISAEKAINKFIDMGYLDDEKFAKAFAKQAFELKNYSENRVKQELFKRGIDREIISEILSDNNVDAVSSITDLISKKYIRKLAQEGGRDKVIAALMRKGFHYSDIKSAIYRIENNEYV